MSSSEECRSHRSSSRSSANSGKEDGKSTASSRQSPFSPSPYVRPHRRRQDEAAASSPTQQVPQRVPTMADFPSLESALGDSSGSGKTKQRKKPVLVSPTKPPDVDVLATLGATRVKDEAENTMAIDGFAALSKENDPLKVLCLRLLMTHEKRGNRSFYQFRAFEIIPSCCYTFKINFIHLLQEEYLELGIKVWEEYQATKTFAYLRKTVVDFLKTQCVFQNEEELCAVDLDYENLPSVMQSFSKYMPEDLVIKDESVLGQSRNLVSTTFRGRQIFISAHEYAYDRHSAGISWGGEFSGKDIYIIEFSSRRTLCRILATCKVFSNKNLVLDLNGIHNSMVGRYEINGSFPAHFDCLAHDIRCLTAASVVETAIREYFPYHVAFMSHGANKCATQELHDATEAVYMDSEDFKVYNSVFESKPEDQIDWREDFNNSKDPLIKGVYTYDNRSGLSSDVQTVNEDSAQCQHSQEGAVQQQQQTGTVQQQQQTVTVQQQQQTGTVQQQQQTGTVQQQQRSQEGAVQHQQQQQVQEVLAQRHYSQEGAVQQQQQTQLAVVQQQVQEDFAPRQHSQEVAVQQQQAQLAVVHQQVHETPVVNQNKFKQTLKGKLIFKRHMNVHLRNHMVGKRPLRGLFQSEAFAAKKNNVLGQIFSQLYQSKPMKLERHLYPLLVLYRSMRDSDDEHPAS